MRGSPKPRFRLCPTMRALGRSPKQRRSPVRRSSAGAPRNAASAMRSCSRAADVSAIEAARENARRERAWRSIMDDPDIQQNLTQAQTTNAEREFKRSGEALIQSVRGAWVHILYPEAPDETKQGTGLRTGYEIRSTRLVNRGGAKSVPQAVWDKVSADGTVLKEIGPQNLVQSLEKVWPSEQGHLTIETVRDWVASFVYLPRLRDEATLNNALLELIENLAYDYAFAASFNEETGVYDDVVDGSTHMSGAFDGGLLVRREAILAAEPEPEPPRPSDEPDPRPGPPPPGGKVEPVPPVEDIQPTRFFATIDVDAERAGLEVARIMDGLLVELTRAPGATIRVSVEIAGNAGNGGYSADVVETVDANARDLKLGDGTWGFEKE